MNYFCAKTIAWIVYVMCQCVIYSYVICILLAVPSNPPMPLPTPFLTPIQSKSNRTPSPDRGEDAWLRAMSSSVGGLDLPNADDPGGGGGTGPPPAPPGFPFPP